jgi:hypothetical protein
MRTFELKEEWKKNINAISPYDAADLISDLQHVSLMLPVFSKDFPLDTLINVLAARAKGLEV